MSTEVTHGGREPAQVAALLEQFLDAWVEGDCGCCSPSVLDEAYDHLELSVALGDRMRKVGIALAQSGQWIVEQEAAEDAARLPTPPMKGGR